MRIPLHSGRLSAGAAAAATAHHTKSSDRRVTNVPFTGMPSQPSGITKYPQGTRLMITRLLCSSTAHSMQKPREYVHVHHVMNQEAHET